MRLLEKKVRKALADHEILNYDQTSTGCEAKFMIAGVNGINFELMRDLSRLFKTSDVFYNTVIEERYDNGRSYKVTFGSFNVFNVGSRRQRVESSKTKRISAAKAPGTKRKELAVRR
mgnify:FL=1